MASTKLTRTPASSSNRKTFTISCWFKRSALDGSGTQDIYSAGQISGGAGSFSMHLLNDTLRLDGNAVVILQTSQVFRDVSAWYHYVLAVDTTQATASDRFKMYINGEQITSFSTDNRSSISQNTDLRWNMNEGHGIGFNYYDTTYYYDGYISEFYNIDGQALDASYFGQTDSTGIWKHKGYSGSYGTNGFYLKFSNSGDLGADSSGNGNDFTKTGNGRQRTDTPSNVFATLNPTTYDSSGMTFSEGNTKVIGRAGANSTAVSTQSFSSGKWYAEFKIGNTHKTRLGAKGTNWYDNNNTQIGTVYDQNGYVYIGTQESGSTDSTIPSYTTGDIIGIFVDKDNNTIKFSKNGTVHGVSQTLSQDEYAFYIYDYSGTGDNQLSVQANFGNPSFSISSGNSDANGYGNFEYSPNDGTYDYLALCTKNLATELAPTIDDGSQYFNTVLYTGNSDTQSITGVGFQPDWTWIKSRSNASWHALQDSSRGSLKTLFSNAGDSETTYTDSVTSFDSDGFSMGDDSEGGSINVSSRTYAAWNWRANGGTTSSNSDGTITSTVQANTTTGFSIITYTGNGTAGATVGHGLGVKPSWFVVKGRSLAGSWVNYHTSLGATKGIPLQGSSAAVTSSAYWNNTEPTSSVLSLGYDGPGNEVNDSGSTFVTYCFAGIEGYSKFGSYTGNGSTDGTFIYTGFRPAFVIIKRTDSSGVWTLIDTTRQNYNLNDRRVHPNLSDAEYSGDGYGWDMLSNGFKQRSTSLEFNGSGASFIYIAFAENPFVTSGGLPVTAR